MKVAFIVRSTLYSVHGGDTIQVNETARHLQQTGIAVDIKRTNEKISYESYDLLHFFNIIRPADILVHINRSKKPFVVSTIFINYSEYDKRERRGVSGALLSLFPADGIEYLKTVLRWLTGKDKLVSTAYLWMGHRRSIKTILSRAREILVQAEEEYTDLVKAYGIAPAHTVIHNGVNTAVFRKPAIIPERENNLVLCVARIEGIKNQYNLIRALNDTAYRLLLIGNSAPNQQSYYRQCREIAAGNVSFIDHLPQKELARYYAAARVHVLPSWFEVCGLSSLEAAAMGCRVVITGKGYARSYFREQAFYCDPANPETILHAVEEAARSTMNGELQHQVLQHYTWQVAAEKTVSVYKKHLA
ncbi:MAG TPA: glycosyltransferase family 4 protein [Ferruginibacter sp.]|nr:glycosyltransferase family 4 protein [Ferruginibacter sp.]